MVCCCFNRCWRVVIGCFALWISSVTVWATDLNRFLPDEKNTIQVFQNSAAKVVYVHRLARRDDKAHTKNPLKPAGSGSGIIWNQQGYIVTNYHVIRGTDAVRVTIGKLTVPARVVAAEPHTDLALLKLSSTLVLKNLKQFKPFALVKKSELMVGQKAIAIGNPYGLDHSLTVGVISALGRKVPGAGGVTIHEMIQTDASINPGNSGGPLLDSQGRLIGLNTVIYSNSGSSAGVGFAVPAEDIHHIVTQLIEKGRVASAGIGVIAIQTKQAAALGVKHGVLIGKVLPHTPASHAKLRGTTKHYWGMVQLGDVITTLNGHAVENYDELYHLLESIKVGQTVTLTLMQNGKRFERKMKTVDIAGEIK